VAANAKEQRMRKVLGIACVAVGFLMSAGRASATPVTFQGGEFDVAFSDLGGDVYRFIYTADFTSWDDSGDEDFITAIEFGFPGWHDVDSVTLVSDTAPGNWLVMQGNGSANNCNENLNQFKICSQEDSLLLSASTEDDQIYQWTIDVAYSSIGDLAALTSNTNSIMAIFYTLDCKTHGRTDEVTCSPKQSGNMSGSTDYSTFTTTTDLATTDTPGENVPEPAVMAMFGAGLILVSRRLRRRSN
jgi:hypothetical protein